MTTPRAYHLVNVFAETRFGGNPLAVFEDGSGLTDAEMQAIAAQMNLSETVFLFPPRLPGCDAHVRIFTPGYELPFAGHPTLGSAAMVRRLGRGGDHVQLGMAAGVFPVRAEGERWQLAAKSPVAQPWVTHTHHLAGALGLSPNEVRAARLIDCGTEQLLVEVCCRETVLNCRPDARLLEAYCRNRQGAWPTSGISSRAWPPYACFLPTMAKWWKTPALARPAPIWAAGCNWPASTR